MDGGGCLSPMCQTIVVSLIITHFVDCSGKLHKGIKVSRILPTIILIPIFFKVFFYKF